MGILLLSLLHYRILSTLRRREKGENHSNKRQVGISRPDKQEERNRKNRRPAKKRLLAFVVIWQVRHCVVHQSSLSKHCERRTTSFWQQMLLSLTPPFAQRQKMGNGLRLMFWRMFVPLQPSTNGRSAA